MGTSPIYTDEDGFDVYVGTVVCFPEDHELEDKTYVITSWSEMSGSAEITEITGHSWNITTNTDTYDIVDENVTISVKPGEICAI